MAEAQIQNCCPRVAGVVGCYPSLSFVECCDHFRCFAGRLAEYSSDLSRISCQNSHYVGDFVESVNATTGYVAILAEHSVVADSGDVELDDWSAAMVQPKSR